MKRTVVLASLLLAPCVLLASDTFRMETRIVELDLNAPAPAEFPKADATTPPLEAILKLGQQSRVEVGRTTISLRDVASDSKNEIPLGISILLTPELKSGQLTYKAQVAHTVPVFSTRAATQPSLAISAAEVATRTLYQSGPCEPDKPVWLNYMHPTNGKAVFVGIRLSREAP